MYIHNKFHLKMVISLFTGKLWPYSMKPKNIMAVNNFFLNYTTDIVDVLMTWQLILMAFLNFFKRVLYLT